MKQRMMKMLGVKELPEVFESTFDVAMKEYEAQGAPYLADAYVAALQQELCIFEVKYDFIRQVLERVRENDLLARFSCWVRAALKQTLPQNLSMRWVPTTPENPYMQEIEMAAFFAQLSFARDTVADWRAHAVPEDVILASLHDCFEVVILLYGYCFGRDGYMLHSHFEWNCIWLAGRMLRIGILNFEMRTRFTSKCLVLRNQKGELAVLVKDSDVAADGLLCGCAGHAEAAYHADVEESDEAYFGYPVDTARCLVQSTRARFDKKDWTLAVKEDTPIVNVHIPSRVPFDKNNVEAAFSRCKEILACSYPLYADKPFACFSWLLDPQLREHVKEGSNIIDFQSRFALFPTCSDGKAVFVFLFQSFGGDLSALPERTSLQRNVKKHYMSGKCIYEQGGIFFYEGGK